MQPWLISCFFGAVISLIFLFIKYLFGGKNAHRLPPGPRGLPLVGHVFSFDQDLFHKIHQFHEKYGKTIYLKMASENVVISADFELAKKYLKTFNSRPQFMFLNAFHDGGITMYNDEEWRTSKKFFLKVSQLITRGESSEDIIHNEIDHFLRVMHEKSERGPIKIAQLTGPASSNVVTAYFLGERYDYDDERRQMFNRVLLRPMEGEDDRIVWFSPFNFIPSAAKFLGILQFPTVKYLRNLQVTCKDYIKERFDQVKKTFDSTAIEPNDFIQSYLLDVEKDKDYTKGYDEAHFISDCFAFLGAGSETTQLYLEWWFQLMADYPEVQEKMRLEVDNVVGDGIVTLSHRSLMPYTEAVIQEVHRYSSIIALNLPHIAPRDTDFGPFLLPKNTQVIINLLEIHMNDDLFPNANSFKPERFLSEDANQFMRNDLIIPFGLGKRSCPGEAIAQSEIFLFTVAILQKFIITSPEKFDGKTYASVFARIMKKPVQINATLRPGKQL